MLKRVGLLSAITYLLFTGITYSQVRLQRKIDETNSLRRQIFELTETNEQISNAEMVEVLRLMGVYHDRYYELYLRAKSRLEGTNFRQLRDRLRFHRRQAEASPELDDTEATNLDLYKLVVRNYTRDLSLLTGRLISKIDDTEAQNTLRAIDASKLDPTANFKHENFVYKLIEVALGFSALARAVESGADAEVEQIQSNGMLAESIVHCIHMLQQDALHLQPMSDTAIMDPYTEAFAQLIDHFKNKFSSLPNGEYALQNLSRHVVDVAEDFSRKVSLKYRVYKGIALAVVPLVFVGGSFLWIAKSNFAENHQDTIIGVALALATAVDVSIHKLSLTRSIQVNLFERPKILLRITKATMQGLVSCREGLSALRLHQRISSDGSPD